LWDKAEKRKSDRPQMIWRMRIECCIPKAYLLIFHRNNGCADAPECDVCTVPVLFSLHFDYWPFI
jgi:hypothetical protein